MDKTTTYQQAFDRFTALREEYKRTLNPDLLPELWELKSSIYLMTDHGETKEIEPIVMPMALPIGRSDDKYNLNYFIVGVTWGIIVDYLIHVLFKLI